MKFGKKSIGAITAGLSLAMTLTGIAPTMALAADPTPATIPSVQKTLKVNDGSTVTATFKYDIKAIALETGVVNSDGTKEMTYTDGPTASVADITLTAENAEKQGTGAISFTKDNKSGIDAFDHAGVYAWTIKEVTEGQDEPKATDGKGTFQNDEQTYTLMVSVANKSDNSGLYFESVAIYKGTATKTNNVKDDGTPVDEKTDKLSFENKYTEDTDENNSDKNPSNLTITKTVTGGQGDQSKDFHFTVKFTAPDILPEQYKNDDGTYNKTQYLTDIAEANGASDEDAAQGQVTFTLRHNGSKTFTGLVAGTTYTVIETEAGKDGYSTSYEGKANGVETKTNSGNLVGEKANDLTVTNDKTSTPITGVIVNNAPFVITIAVAAAGAVAYGAAKRKLEK